MLLFAIENGINNESDMPTFRRGLAAVLCGLATGAVVGALGVHSNRFEIIRLYITSYKCFDLK